MQTPSNAVNYFIAHLTPEDRALIEPHLRPYDFPQGQVLFKAEEPIKYIYFPTSGVVSLIVGMANGQFVEAGMFGRNTAVGASAVLNGPTALNQAIIQVASIGLLASVATIKPIVQESQGLRVAFSAHAQMITAQAQQVAACNAVHHLEERLCRWLLQVRDLTGTGEFAITQEFLSQMLGVQRTTVNHEARRLQAAGLIKYRRGHVQIVDG